MGKARRNQRPKKAQVDELVYDESLSKADIPSTKELSSKYYNDEIDDYHEGKFKSLMEKGVKFDNADEEYDSEDEVMPLDIPEEEEDDEEDDEDEAEDEDDRISMGSDLEDRSNDGLPDALAWGQKKKLYYDTDYKEYSKSMYVSVSVRSC
ncbi:unnamed protein product [Staurois parvus]|uniref:Uncharacterized protein n=1 Tax=Staurois parvus TaxID=386267 RepID=A0ABN9BJU4_9NEOB|nr:unnamed protein product [Staurois parvus]